jgi:dipeptidyl aminopeptidase/acylaminoacyl peptidase
MPFLAVVIVALTVLVAPALAESNKAFDAAVAFGARPSVADLSLSPDGMTVAYVAPSQGLGSALFTLRLEKDAKAKPVLVASGKPERLSGCHWVSNDRLACGLYGVARSQLGLLPFTRLIAVNADGSNLRQLSTQAHLYTRGLQLGGGMIIDWLPDQDGSVLMSRHYLPDDHTGSHIASTAEGLGVDLLDTRTLSSRTVEPPRRDAAGYLSDGRGTVRIMAIEVRGPGDQDTGVIAYYYRTQDSRDWQKLGNYNYVDHSGFAPLAVDHDRNIAYGLKKKDGRQALYSVALDGSMSETLVFSRPDVDIDGLIRIGRRYRVVGVSYATDYRTDVYFDPEIDKITASISKALATQSKVWIADSSVDEKKLLLFSASDDDPGVYYLLDRQTHHLDTFLVAREELEGVKLAKVKPVTYTASDGMSIPGYLTLPPGLQTAKGLPAIVMPHGGPGARDEWGFDWLAQFYAARGYAVLQPNFRGSAGYGDAWYLQNGFRSWPTAIGDVLDAGRWLVAQGIADPAKLAIVGWSYGGYAALQAAVTDSGVFKAVVAIAPVTDLNELRNEEGDWSDYDVVSQFIGKGPQVRAGSPAQNAGKIKAPVLLFHGALDRTVPIAQSEHMARSLEKAEVPHELVRWDNLDHSLDDSSARTEMLRRSDEFLRRAFGM